MYRFVALLSCICLLSSCEEALYSEPAESGQPYYHQIDDYTLDAPRHLVRDIPSLSANQKINVIVEIPTGTLDKWEVNKESGDLQWEIKSGTPRIVEYLGYPGNYGFIPQTLLPGDAGGDGDPLDVLILGPSLPRGAIIEVEVIGVLRMLDRGARDDKIIATIAGTPFEKVSSIADLEEDFPGVVSIISTWFDNYKGDDKIEIIGFEEKSEALQIFELARKAYSK